MILRFAAKHNATMKAPPLLPEAVLHRVLRVAQFDGMGVLAVAAFFALASASAGDFSGAMIGLLVAAAGAIELHGTALLREGETRGMNWLVASQIFLLVVVLGYCALRLSNVDLTLLREAMTPELRAMLVQAGYTEEQFLRMVYRLTYEIFAVLTVFYQGGMAIYYWRRREAVVRALSEE